MLRLMETIIRGRLAQAEDQATDRHAEVLIEQKIREAQAALRSGKTTLASLIQQERIERRALDTLEKRIADMTQRAEAALADRREDLALQAAAAIADMENEARVRRDTLQRLEERMTRLRHSLEQANRRIIDLKQGAIGARAVARERRAQAQLSHGTALPHIAEAEELIARVLNADDPFERDEIRREIDAQLDKTDLAEALGAAGYGGKSKTDAQDVLARLKKSTNDKE